MAGDVLMLNSALQYGPAAYYRLASDANDLTVNARNGSLVASPSFTTGPFTGQGAVDLNGTTQYITTNYNPFVNGTTRTFMGWFNRDGTAHTDPFFGAASGGNRAWIVTGSQDINFQPGTGATVTFPAVWPGNGQWVHWALVFNESADTAELFINGVSKGVVAATATWGALGNLVVGSDGFGNDADGKVAQFAVFERGLTGAEIRAASGLAELALNDGSKFRLIEHSYPTPDRDISWASSVDTEGETPANLRYQNRSIPLKIRIYGSSASDALTQLGYLEQAVGRINAEQGTLTRQSMSGDLVTFDLKEGAADYPQDFLLFSQNSAEVDVTFTAAPFGRGVPTLLSDHAETTLPVVVGVDTGLKGDVPGVGVLTIDEDQGQDQWTLLWGTQSRYYDSSADAALFYEAEGRTLQSGSFTSTALDSTASGSSPKAIKQDTLVPSYQSILSTQATGGGNHLKHIGTYRVFARFQRPTSNSGAVSVRLQWGEGDFRRFTTNDDDGADWDVDESEGVWTLVDMGLVRLTKATSGTQRWEGRFLGKSTVNGDDLYMDYFFLVPVDEGYGEIKIEPQTTVPTSLTAHDEFDQTAGSLTGGKTTNNVSAITAANPGVLTVTAHGLSNGQLIWIEGITGTMGPVLNGYRTVAGVAANTFNVGVNTTALTYVSGGTVSIAGKALPVGGSWYGNSMAGSATDFTIDTAGHTAQRTATADADTYSGRYAFAAANALTNFNVQADIKWTANVGVMGVFGRYSDPNNWVRALIIPTSGTLVVVKRVAGTATTLTAGSAGTYLQQLNTPYTVVLNVDSGGRINASASVNGVAVAEVQASDSDLATGGTLASGVAGIYDANATATASTRTFDNFVLYTFPGDAAVFASQSIEIRADRVLREDSGGTLMVTPSSYRGSYFRPPPSGMEGRSLRTLVKMSRNNIDNSADTAIDDASYRILHTPRYLVAPEP